MAMLSPPCTCAAIASAKVSHLVIYTPFVERRIIT
jgi:hypothetical protein